MVLVQSSSFLHVFMLGILGLENVFQDILERKNVFLAYRKSMVLVENWLFLHVFISGNIVQENVFYDILERKNVFLAYKKKKFKKSKN